MPCLVAVLTFGFEFFSAWLHVRHVAKTTSPFRIMERLIPILSSKSFRFRRSQNDYIRRTAYGYDEVTITGFSPSRGAAESGLPLYEGEIILSLRHDVAQEKLIRLKLNYFDEKDRTCPTAARTVTGRFHPFDVNRDKTVVVSYTTTEHDEKNAAEQISEMLSADGFKWFETYANLANFEREINTPPLLAAHRLWNNLEGRAYNGIAAAAACYGRARAEHVARQYLEAMLQIEELDDWTKGRLEKNIPLILLD